MKKRYTIIGGILAIILLLFTAAHAEHGRNETVNKLGRDVVLLNLVNGLYLSDDQIKTLLQKNTEAESIRKQFEEEAGKSDAAMENVLDEIRSVLIKGSEIPEDLKSRFHEQKEYLHRLEDDLAGRIGKMENEVENLLTPNQKLTIQNYKPCIIPPGKGLIGQSAEAAGEMLVRVLERTRMMPEERMNMAKDFIADRHIRASERHLGPMDDSTRTRIRENFTQTVDKARSMSDQDFLVQKEDLARSLMPEKGGAMGTGKVLGKVGRLLLDSRMIAVLEDRFNL